LDQGIQSHDELVLERAAEMGLDRMGEDNNEDDNDDNDDEGDASTPPTAMPPTVAAPTAAPAVTATPKVAIEEEEDPDMLVPEQEAAEALEIFLSDEEPEPLHPCLFTMLMRYHQESPSRMYDDMDDPTLADYDVEDWFPEDRSHD
jgi:hypothetical protein